MSGNAWVFGNAWVSGNAWVFGDGDYITICGLGDAPETITFFKCEDETIKVNWGIFFGTLDEFEEKVMKNEFAEEYLMMVDLVKVHFHRKG